MKVTVSPPLVVATFSTAMPPTLLTDESVTRLSVSVLIRGPKERARTVQIERSRREDVQFNSLAGIQPRGNFDANMISPQIKSRTLLVPR